MNSQNCVISIVKQETQTQRHTTRHVASDHCAALSPGGGGGWGEVPTLARWLPTFARGTYPGGGYLP